MNKYIDKEYQTQIIEEVKYLKSKGINYEFVKIINGASTYKYKKSKKLFIILSELYK